MNHIEQSEMLAHAVRAATCAADAIREAFSRPRDTTRHKGGVDLVTATDELAERIVRRELEGTFPVLGEEGGGPTIGDDVIWVVDPIDGTTNFVHSTPHVAVSIGLHGAPVGVVFDVMRNECFATANGEAFLNDARLSPLAPPPLNSALLASGFPYDRRETDDDNTEQWRAFMKRCQGVRRNGAAALDLAWVAAGRLDGYWEPRLKPWDLAAGVHLVRATGGVVTTYDGGVHRLDSPTLVCAAPPLHAEMLEVLRHSQA
ncbi:MAG: myo-inositol-1(or 4)-monophosphatase [Bradymonadia bacterium]|jgi:myo-inositol-1(or 4)-monophosphatase